MSGGKRCMCANVPPGIIHLLPECRHVKFERGRAERRVGRVYQGRIGRKGESPLDLPASRGKPGDPGGFSPSVKRDPRTVISREIRLL